MAVEKRETCDTIDLTDLQFRHIQDDLDLSRPFFCNPHLHLASVRNIYWTAFIGIRDHKGNGVLTTCI